MSKCGVGLGRMGDMSQQKDFSVVGSGLGSSRRDFLKKSSGFGLTILPAYLTSGRATGNPKRPPSQRLNLGCIGAGGRGARLIPWLCQKGNAEAIALVDVDFETPDKIGETLKAFPKARKFHDFRTMYDEMAKDLDAVVVATPDHTHFTATIQAMALGKPVFVDKPLAHTFEECEILMRAEKKFGVVTQMGNQGHTSAGSEQFKQMLAAGVIDDVVKVEAWKGAGLWFMEAAKRIQDFPKGEEMPKSLKTWDLWCGPREVKEFHSLYHPFDWRGFFLYGGGMLGDWGCHIIDYIHHYLGLGLPTKIKPVKLEDHNQVIFPLSSELEFEFPERGEKRPAVAMKWRAGAGVNPEVDKKYWSGGQAPGVGGAGTLMHRKQEDYLVQRNTHWSTSKVISAEAREDLKPAFDATGPAHDHMESFVQACMGNGKTESPFSVGGELTQVLNLGVIAEFLNQELTFDRETKRFVGNDRANELLAGPAPREEWVGHYRLA